MSFMKSGEGAAVLSHKEVNTIPASGRRGRGGASVGFVLGILLVLFSAAAVRLYKLGVPSMWWDEVLTVITSTFPAQYILKWTHSCEVHPPLFYFLTKVATLLGTSDALLRLPWAFTGVLQILAVYVFCARFISRSAGIVSASLLAATPLHVLLSRQLRPYPLIMLLQTLSLHLFRDWLEKPRLIILLGLALVNAVTAMLHYMGLGLVGVQILFACAWFAVHRPAGGFKRWLWYCAANGTACLPGLYFFQTIGIRNDMINAEPTGHVFERLLLGLDGVVRPLVQSMPLDTVADSFSPASWICLSAILVVSLLGVRALWKRDQTLGALLPFTLAALMLMVALSGQGFFRPRHLLPLFLPLFLLAGCALACLIPSRGFLKALALFLAAALPFACMHGKDEQLYSPASYGKYRMEAQAAAGLPAGDAVYSTLNQTLYNALSWYLDRQMGRNPLRLTAMGPDTRTARFGFITDSNPGNLPATERLLADSLGPPVGISKLHDLSVLHWVWERVPVHAIGQAPASISFEASPRDMFRDSYSLKNILFLPESHLAAGSANDRPGELSYAFEFPDTPPPAVLVSARYRTTGPGNHLQLDYSLDGAPPRTAFDSDSQEPGELSQSFFVVAPESRARRLVITTSLLTGRQTPDYPGDNLSTNGLFRLRVDSLPEPVGDQPPVSSITVNGLGELENLSGGAARWGLGPRLRAVFDCPRTQTIKLAMRYGVRYPGQVVDLSLNGRQVGSLTLSPPKDDPWGELSLDLDVRQGRNELVIAFDKFNHRPHSPAAETFAPADPRKLAIILHRLAVGNAELID